jgi:hypothetical protein
MSDTNIGNNNATDAAGSTGNQAPSAKTYSQEEVDNMMARMRGSLEKKLLKPYEDLGDPEELRNIRQEWDKKQHQEQVKRGEFEKILQEKADKWNAEIQKRDSIIKEYKVNTPLVSAAAKFRAVAPEQVKQLLSNRVRLNDMGDVEVLDEKGTVKYNDGGAPYQVDDLVREFLDSNPHFVSASPSTTHSRSNTGMNNTGQFDLSKLDFSNAGDRRRYAEAKKAGLIK